MISMVVIATQINAQKIKTKEVPNSVMQAFGMSYPSQKEVTWNKDGSNYQAQYAKSGEKSVTYDSTGAMIETEKEIKVSALPPAINEYVKKNYNNYTIKEAIQITASNGVITYETEINGMDLIFDSRGMFMKSEKSKLVSALNP